MLRWTKGRKLRILDFDIENRPLSYMGSDFTSAEITAIAWGFVGEEGIYCQVLGEVHGMQMLSDFLDAYEEADIVTGHYIRKHDLPIVNAGLMEYELPLLGPKLSSDTKLDLVKRKELSMSQESLSAMYGLSHPKEHMNQPQWREANRLTPEGIEETKRRVIGDVRQHKLLREKLLEVGALGPPKLWRP